MRRGFSWWEALVVVGMVVLLGTLLLPALLKTKSGCRTSKCSSNLRQLALAAISYAGDRRFYPHVSGLRELDGDWTTPDAPRTMVALVYFGYLDAGSESFVCRSSADLQAPLGDAQLDDRRLWTFGPSGTQNPQPDVSPLTSGVPLSGSLVNSTWLSYGWTRKPMNANARGAALLGADRSIRLPSAVTPAPPGTLGNHPDGWNVVHVDASTTFLSARYDRGDGVEPFDYLGATGDASRDGFLAMEWAGANPLGKTP